MFDRKTYSRFFKKAALLLYVSSVFTYGEGKSPRLEPQLETQESVLSNFLKKSLHITYDNYDRSLGTVDLFMMHEKNRLWAQVGFGGLNLFGAGTGYRHFVKGDYPYQDWFLGFYAYGRFKPNAVRHRYKWNTGVELATAYTQWTLNGYGLYSFCRKGKENIDYREGNLGVSLRISTYYWQKMKMFGRLNPFIFAAHTQVKDTQEKPEPITMQHGGIGLRWELPYGAVECKWIVWNPESAIKPLQGGIQFEFAGRRNKEVSHASHRMREMPQYYEPNYEYKYGDYSVKEETSEKPNTEDDVNNATEETQELKEPKEKDFEEVADETKPSSDNEPSSGVEGSPVNEELPKSKPRKKQK